MRCECIVNCVSDAIETVARTQQGVTQCADKLKGILMICQWVADLLHDQSVVNQRDMILTCLLICLQKGLCFRHLRDICPAAVYVARSYRGRHILDTYGAKFLQSRALGKQCVDVGAPVVLKED